MNAAVQEFDAGHGPTPPVQPQVFVRVFGTPPGAPWEQSRAADMEARHGAPLPVADLLFRLKRLAPWGPGRPGRFAVFYIRVQEFQDPFETEVDVDGQKIKVVFGSGGDQVRRLQRVALLICAAAASAAVLGGGVMLALSGSSEAEARIEALEQQSAQRLKAAQAFQRQKDLTRNLSAAVGRSGRMRDVIADLSWVATSKAPEAKIVAVHWERGVLGVEVRGEEAPFVAPDRLVERIDKPLRPGVWLWGVGRVGGAPAREVGP